MRDPDERRLLALRRLYAGVPASTICAELSVTWDELSAWRLSTAPEELRPVDDSRRTIYF